MTKDFPKTKLELDQWLDRVDYSIINSAEYVPSEFALKFLNFIKLVNGGKGEDNLTPAFHLRMLDEVSSDSDMIANLCFRGSGKTTIFVEYFAPYCAIYREIPGLKEIFGMMYVSDSMENGVMSARKNLEFRYENSPFLQHWLPKVNFTNKEIYYVNRDNQKFGLKMFGIKTGFRGSKIFGKRPNIAVLDDLISTEDARSPTELKAITDGVYTGVLPALDPKNRKVILNGTPFNKEDIVIKAIESGEWSANVWPICERFPCSREEFKGAWEDRFTYDFVKRQYEIALNTGNVAAFYQEYMLRISSEDERLVQDTDIRWYSRNDLLTKRSSFNFYITTDFATSARQTADYSVISVWAYNNNGDWFLVDGVAKRQTMDRTIEHLFRLVAQYKPQQVGVEVSGQQGAFIQWLQSEMLRRNVWFNFASSEQNGAPGIRPKGDKLTRFNLVVPWFKSGKFYFPEELRTGEFIGLFLQQLRLATTNGIKGKDDCLDTISMLAVMNAWKPSEELQVNQQEDSIWGFEDDGDYENSLSNYLV